MKKKLLGFIILATLAITVINVHITKDSEKGLILSNIEAMANSSEGGGGIDQIKCNAAIPVVCIILNNETVKGERY